MAASARLAVPLRAYAILALVHLGALAAGAGALGAISKVALMPALYLSVKQTTRRPVSKWWSAAIALSWLGDVLLLRHAGSGLGISARSAFLLGLASFLLAHGCYIRRASRLRRAIAADAEPEPTASLRRERDTTAAWVRVGLAALTVGFLLAALKLVPWALVLGTPVLLAGSVYAVVLLAMAAAMGRLARRRPAYRLAAVGAVLFVVSDAIIGLGLVRPSLFSPSSHQLLVMAPYVLAQAGLSVLAREGDTDEGAIGE